MTTLLPRIGFALLALAPLCSIWIFALQAGKSLLSQFRFALGLGISTLSSLLFVAYAFNDKLLGPDYSSQRFTFIYANVFLAAIMIAVVAKSTHPVKQRLLLQIIWIALLWLYIAFANAAI